MLCLSLLTGRGVLDNKWGGVFLTSNGPKCVLFHFAFSPDLSSMLPPSQVSYLRLGVSLPFCTYSHHYRCLVTSLLSLLLCPFRSLPLGLLASEKEFACSCTFDQDSEVLWRQNWCAIKTQSYGNSIFFPLP